MFKVGDVVTVFGPVGGTHNPEPRRLQIVSEKNLRFVTLNDGTKWSLAGEPYPKPKKQNKPSVTEKRSLGSRRLQYIKTWDQSHEEVMDARVRKIVAWKVAKLMVPQDIDNATPEELDTFVSFAKRCMPDHFYDDDPRVYRIVFGRNKDE